MNLLTIGEIPYLNCAPFFWRGKADPFEAKIERIWAHPKELGNLARAGRVDAGPISLLDTLELQETYEPLPFGISSVDHAQSVILFSKRPHQELHGEQVGLTVQSATSTQLLKMLLKERYNVSPNFTAGVSENDEARLLIGDEALFALLDTVTERKFPHRLDLGHEWKMWKGHPFVFARWMVRKDLGEGQKNLILEWLNANLSLFATDPELIVREFEALRGWKIPDAKEYLFGFNYRPSESDYLGSLTTLSQFSSHLATSRS